MELLLATPLISFLKIKIWKRKEVKEMEEKPDFGMKLLSDLIGWSGEEIIKSLRHKEDYNLIIRKKKSGGVRKTYAPHKEMKRLQRRFLRSFLYKISLLGHKEIFGGVPGRSYVDNAKHHCYSDSIFFYRLDLKDAFPSIEEDYLRSVLKDIFLNEIRRIQGKEVFVFESSGFVIHNKNLPKVEPLFSWKKVRWFRKMIDGNDSEVAEVIEQFLNLVMQIITYRRVMIQGIPTSPWLLNLVIVYSGVIDEMKKFLKEREIVANNENPQLSLYVDDFIISSAKPIPWKVRCELEEIIRSHPPLRINSMKSIYSSRYRIAPMVTGLRIVEMPEKEVEKQRRLVIFRKAIESLDLSEKEKIALLAKRKKELTSLTHFEARLPKKLVRKIRGIIHWANYGEENYQTLKNVVCGYIANIKPIYGDTDNFPNQILVPYEKFKKNYENK